MELCVFCRQLHITNEIIHNPGVNQRLKEMDVKFIEETAEGKNFDAVQEGDVVILPAFGASVQEMKLLNDRYCLKTYTVNHGVPKSWNAGSSGCSISHEEAFRF